MKYVICPYCGAHLDFGEKYDCQKDSNKDTKKNINAGAHAFINTKKEKNNG